MANIRFYSQQNIPLEMHKARMVQKLNLLPIEERKDAALKSGCNTFLLHNEDVFLDMLTDSGVNAMSDRQYAAMMEADDSYAGSRTFYEVEKATNDIFGTAYFLPAHQGRACENLLAKVLVKPGLTVLTNYHFTTTKAHILLNGGVVEELICDEGLEVESNLPFKGNFDINKLTEAVKRLGKDKIAFVRIELGTNLIGGQPVSLDNIEAVSSICRDHDIPLVTDASLLADNLYFLKIRDPRCQSLTTNEITLRIGELSDIIYFSARKLGCVRGGGICTSNEKYADMLRPLIPIYEGFLTYGGMSIREMAALKIGLAETLDIDIISQTPLFVEAFANELTERGVPIVTPAGGLGCHVDAMRFCEHLPQNEYRAGALAAAIYVASGVRSMERGTLSEERNPDGTEHFAEMELARLAVPKRVFTLSHIKYASDRIGWLYENRKLIGGLTFKKEPKMLRFFLGELCPTNDWIDKLVMQFRRDFGDSL